MGIRVYYEEVPFCGYKELFEENYVAFREAFIDSIESDKDISVEGFYYLDENPTIQELYKNASLAALHDIFDAFLYFADDWRPTRKLIKGVNVRGYFYAQHYWDEYDYLSTVLSKEALELWDLFFTGRSVFDYEPEDWFCYWFLLSEKECVLLRKELRKKVNNLDEHFGVECLLEAIENKEEDGLMIYISS